MNLIDAIVMISVQQTIEFFRLATERQIEVTLLPPEIAALTVRRQISDEEYLIIVAEVSVLGHLSEKSISILREAASKTLDQYPIGSNVRGN